MSRRELVAGLPGRGRVTQVIEGLRRCGLKKGFVLGTRHGKPTLFRLDIGGGDMSEFSGGSGSAVVVGPVLYQDAQLIRVDPQGTDSANLHPLYIKDGRLITMVDMGGAPGVVRNSPGYSVQDVSMLAINFDPEQVEPGWAVTGDEDPTWRGTLFVLDNGRCGPAVLWSAIGTGRPGRVIPVPALSQIAEAAKRA